MGRARGIDDTLGLKRFVAEQDIGFEGLSGNSRCGAEEMLSAHQQVTVRMVSTDADGKFDLGLVKHSDYRLLLSPYRGFNQPEKLECSSTCDVPSPWF